MPFTLLALALWSAPLAAPQIRTSALQDAALDDEAAQDTDQRPLQDASVVPA